MKFEESNNEHETVVDKVEDQQGKNEKIENFKFDKIVKKKKQVVKKRQEISDKKKIVYKPYKYGRDQFDDLDALSQFLLRDYHKIEAHANKLLSDSKFIEWLSIKSKDEEQFNEWVENIL
ncbi:hypothetical protein [Haloplasma contractile]|uniref:Uncharacterized protein n=1 Tax=Haloplasma contractile SSD-17B TaxID=1033810 RepID=U2FLA2_9MOLU|nr:hypothetical protein [Haloplasma contractile]ERJ11979.1 hypothetical protein HLPCO_001893 [Haloplasma contractile SSD-17B]